MRPHRSFRSHDASPDYLSTNKAAAATQSLEAAG